MSVVEAILDAAELTDAIEGAEDAVASASESSGEPSAPAPPPQKNRTVQLSVLNHTQFRLVPDSSYFYSGRFDVAPADVAPFDTMTFTAVDADDSILTGVSGAVTFSMTLPNGASCRVGIGFSNPEWGSYKTNIAFDPDDSQAEGASPVADAAAFADTVETNDSNQIVEAKSASFSGTDRARRPVVFGFTGSASPGAQSTVTIVQEIRS